MAKDTLKSKVYQAMQEMLPKYPEGLRPRDLTNLIINEKRSDALPHSIGSDISIVNNEHPDEFYKEKVKGGVVYFSRKNNASKSSRSIFVPMTTLAFSSKKRVIKSDSVMTKETSKSKIIAAAEEVLSLKKYSNGLSWGELVPLVEAKLKDSNHNIPRNTIGGGVFAILKSAPDKFINKANPGEKRVIYAINDAKKSLTKKKDSNASKSDSVMTKETSKSKIIAATEKVLEKHSGGLRWGKLFPLVEAELEGSNIPRNTIWGCVSTILTTDPDKFINKAKLGKKYVYAINNAKKSSTKKKSSKASKSKAAPKTPKYLESAYYQPFANYLMNGESDAHPECTTAIPLGGNKFGGKWGTPDVIGVFRAQKNEVVDFPPEIISAEIKNNSSNLVTAFGQACAYRLFSHKTYLVTPDSGDAVHIERLCQIFGIGLVYFDPSKRPNESMFSLKLPAQKHSPDMFYVNQKIDIVAKELGML